MSFPSKLTFAAAVSPPRSRRARFVASSDARPTDRRDVNVDDFSGNDRWQTHAACRGMDARLFYPQRGESAVEAKAVCAICPVREDCLTDAIAHLERHGIWGGKTERDRRGIARSTRTRPTLPFTPTTRAADRPRTTERNDMTTNAEAS
jgi:WhiB family redox-sensing transcriptional regulator